jgi:hypothetical protein
MKEEWSAKTLVVIVVDLSRPHSAVADLRYWVQQVCVCVCVCVFV